MKPIRTLLMLVRRFRLRRLTHMGRGAVVLGLVIVRGTGRILIGDDVRFEATQAAIDLHAGPGAEIVVESGAVIESGCSIEALRSVRIGAGARLGAFTKVMDNHFHVVEGDRAQQPASEPVVVGPGAAIGPRAVILPGADIGRGARVGAASVVSRRVPDGADVYGFPVVVRTRAL